MQYGHKELISDLLTVYVTFTRGRCFITIMYSRYLHCLIGRFALMVPFHPGTFVLVYIVTFCIVMARFHVLTLVWEFILSQVMCLRYPKYMCTMVTRDYCFGTLI